jgi:hypothetical protein
LKGEIWRREREQVTKEKGKLLLTGQ